MRTILLFLISFLFSVNSFAGISIEPIVGYSLGSEVQVNNGKSYQWGKGLGLGGKFAFENDKSHGLAFGFDYLKSDVDIADIDKNVKTDDLGVYLGYKLPAFLKFYGEYIFSSSGDTEINGRHRNLSGTGWKLGMGTTIIPFIDLNLDYRKITYDKIDFNAVMFSLSLPLHFFE